MLALLFIAALPEPECHKIFGERLYCMQYTTPLAKGAPLLLYLHGRGGRGEDNALGLRDAAIKAGFIYAYATGEKDSYGATSWQGTTCCDRNADGDTDVVFLSDVIEDIVDRTGADAKRVSVAGYSNGAFMSHRLACDTDKVSKQIAVAGAHFPDASRCRAKRPVSVLVIHGLQDDVVRYIGGTGRVGNAYAGAVQTADTWAMIDKCAGLETGPNFETLVAEGTKATTVMRAHACPKGSRVELWTMPDVGHRIRFTGRTILRMIDFLE